MSMFWAGGGGPIALGCPVQEWPCAALEAALRNVGNAIRLTPYYDHMF